MIRRFPLPLLLLAPLLAGLLHAARPGLDRVDWNTLSDLELRDDLRQLERGPRWLDDYDQARHVARARNTSLLLLFVNDEEPSKRFKARVLANPELWPHLRHYILVELHVVKEPDLAFEFGLRAVPALLWIDPEGRVRHQVTGHVPVEDLVTFIDRIRTPGALALPPDQAGLIRDLKKNPEDKDLMIRVLDIAHDDKRGADLRKELRALHPAPTGLWIELLSHSALRVRLGALELLEEWAGHHFNFDPWAPPGEQEEALKRWQAWHRDASGRDPQRFAPLTRAQLRSAVRDLASDSESHVLRAIATLERGGPDMLPHIEEWLEGDRLSDAQQERLRRVRLTLWIARLNQPDAPGLAFRLRRGPLDTRMRILRDLAASGRAASPVLLTFLDDPEVLIRETVVEQLLTIGDPDTRKTVLRALADEPNIDIALTAMRVLAKTNDAAATDWIQTQLDSENEERKLGALQALRTGHHKRLAKKATQALQDSRWRVRAEAATTLGAIKHRKALPALLDLAEDPDAYTRTAALGACLRMARSQNKKTPLVESWFEKNPDDFDVIVRVACDANVPFPDKLTEAIHQLEKPDLVHLLRVMMECGSQGVPLALDLAEHRDSDIRASALRILAANGLVQGSSDEKRRAEALLAAALAEADASLAPLLLDLIRLPRPQNDSFGNTDLTRLLEQARNEGTLDEETDEELSDLFGAFVEEAPEPTPPPEDELSLDDLADAFEEGGTPISSNEDPHDLQTTVKSLFQDNDHPETRRAAALLLLQYGDDSAVDFLIEQADHIPAERLTDLFRRRRKQAGTLRLAKALHTDTRTDVRSAALQVIAVESTARDFFPLIDTLGDKKNPTRIGDLPLSDWSVRRSLGELPRSASAPHLQKWLPLPEDPSDPDRLRALLGLQLTLQHRTPPKDLDLEAMTEKTDDAHLRALTWLTLGSVNRGLTPGQADTLLADTSSDVRLVLPFLYLRGTKTWPVHPNLYDGWRIDDQKSAWTPRLDQEIEQRLRTLRKDPAPDIRFLAGLALHSHRKDLNDPEAWHADFPGPQSRKSIRTLTEGYFMQRMRSGAGSLDPAIVNWLTGHVQSDYQRKQIERFASKPAASPSDDTPTALADGNAQPDSDNPPVLLFVYSPGCDDCETVEIYLEAEQKRVPNLEIQALNIENPATQDLLSALYRRHGIPLTEIGLTPVVAGAGRLGAGSVDLTREFVTQIVESSVMDPGVGWLPVVETPEQDEIDAEVEAAQPSAPPPQEPVATASLPDPTPGQRLLLLLLPAWIVLAHPLGRLRPKTLLAWALAFLAGSLLPLPFPEIPVWVALMIALPLLALAQRRGRPAPDTPLSSRIQDPTPPRNHRQHLVPLLAGGLLFLAGSLLPPAQWTRIASEWNPVHILWGLALLLAGLYAAHTRRTRLHLALSTLLALTIALAFTA